MTDIAIRAENLGKQFHIGELQRGYKTFREVTVEAFLGPFRRLARLVRGQAAGAADLDDTFWALRDVGFEIRNGEVVGVIGRNGAGKSTLLKILSRITEPTSGYVDIHGRVGCLLEVGTGFHQELTGRENIYLNGSILGMRKTEIDSKFDEIVAFGEIDKFLDTPVKHYSSGMQTRLGFAVAAHLDPEILLVDEVLAVGDVAFQRKCLGKMQDVARSGRTVVFVSHNMGSITQLCDRAIWIDHGHIRSTGDPATVVAEYLSESTQSQGVWINSADVPAQYDAQIKSVRILAPDGEPLSIINFDQDFRIEILYHLTRFIRNLTLKCWVTDHRGAVVWTSWDIDSTEWEGRTRVPGQYASVCHVPGKLLRPGRYLLTIAVESHNPLPEKRAETVTIALEISGVGYLLDRNRLGAITPVFDWEVIALSDDETSLTDGEFAG